MTLNGEDRQKDEVQIRCDYEHRKKTLLLRTTVQKPVVYKNNWISIESHQESGPAMQACQFTNEHSCCWLEKHPASHVHVCA